MLIQADYMHVFLGIGGAKYAMREELLSLQAGVGPILAKLPLHPPRSIVICTTKLTSELPAAGYRCFIPCY